MARVCGPDPDAELIRFSGDLAWLERQGVSVRRYNLGQEPGAFAADPAVRRALGSRGVASLPLVFVGDDLLAEAAYPSRAALAEALSSSPLHAPPDLPDASSASPRAEVVP